MLWRAAAVGDAIGFAGLITPVVIEFVPFFGLFAGPERVNIDGLAIIRDGVVKIGSVEIVFLGQHIVAHDPAGFPDADGGAAGYDHGVFRAGDVILQEAQKLRPSTSARVRDAAFRGSMPYR